MPAPLGIRRNEIWAYKYHLAGPLVPARVLAPGQHYDAGIEILMLEGPTKGTRLWTRRSRLPCKWEERESWLSTRPDFRRDFPVVEEVQDAFELPADSLFGMGERALRRIVREELQAILNVPPKVGYNAKEAAAALGVSTSTIYVLVKQNRIVPSYIGSRAIFPRDELERYVMGLPDEPGWH